MRAKIIPIGTSKGLRIPKKVLDQLDINKEVELEVLSNGIFLKPVIEDEFEDQLNVALFMQHFTGFPYSFAVSSSRKWGSEDSLVESRQEGYYQLMPDHIDSGFFDWYCNERPYHQFFKTKEKAMLYFLKFWWSWTKKMPIVEEKSNNIIIVDESRFQEEDFKDYLKEIIRMGGLEGAALGIAKLLMDKDYSSLTPPQKFTFQKDVIDYYYKDSCESCASPIPWVEMLHAVENGGNCSWCANQIEKAQKD
ncbi:MAG: AbrB/MazE/SpoVT family DNA-binding domain-containing protein [Opitutaceae bacterium]|nr:AbrB/MazE/SpoVT family DNA-binding domain-containing protein [Cytophagales bacterium]